jgi:hypothetical protein
MIASLTANVLCMSQFLQLPGSGPDRKHAMHGSLQAACTQGLPDPRISPRMASSTSLHQKMALTASTTMAGHSRTHCLRGTRV